MEASTELRDFALRVYDALSRGDHEFLSRSLSRESALLVIGTDPAEWWKGHATAARMLQAQLAEMGGFPVRPGEPEAYVEGSVGWIADQPRIALPDGEMAVRLTLVVHREQDDWKITHWHISVGVSNEEAFGKELTTE